MFTPPGHDPTVVKTIVLVFVLATMAQLLSVRLARGAERFMDNERGGAVVELRGSATVAGDEIRLRQVARWGDADQAALDPIGDLVVAHFEPKTAFRQLDVAELKSLLTGAGVNVGTLNFTGPVACRVDRSDATFAPGDALDQMAAVTHGQAPAVTAVVADGPFRTLRQLLTTDLAERLNLPEADLQVSFRTADEAVLRLTEPHSKFDLRPQRVSNLGYVSWNVTIDGKTRAFVTADARAWRQQTVVARPLMSRQAITDADVESRRLLVDNLPDDALLGVAQVVGQSAARDLKPGTVVTAHMVDPTLLVKSGQDVFLDTAAGGVRLRTVARVMDSGTLGQTVRLRNAETRELMNAVVTGSARVTVAPR